jgi:Arc/MetJ-type ribon-helix-helix transcriptional regulator
MPRGRPKTGRRPDKKVTVYLSPEDIAGLDRLADRRTVQGKNTSRSDVIRDAVKRLLEEEGSERTKVRKVS